MKKSKIDISQAHMYGVTDEAAQEFVDWRDSIRKPLTQRAFERAMMTAVRCNAELGITPDTAIEIAIDKGWQGVTFEYIRAELERRHEAMTRMPAIRQEPEQDTIQRLTNRDWAN